VRAHRDGYILDGKLTLKGVTRDVPLALELNGFGPDAYGGTRAGFSATAEINRRDFGVNFAAVMETGGAVVSDKVTIQLEIEAVLQQH
jgi:polyisoprenoid-binding protein YceI